MSKIFVVSAPSGAGKTTLNNRLMRENPSIEIAISHTTRKKREGETNGKSYHFIDKDSFQKLVAQEEMLEWAEVFGNLYGTSKSEIDRIFQKNHHVLLEIDVQGCKSVLANRTDTETIFILPPSIESLWLRLEQRGTDKLQDRWRRFLAAKHEIEIAHIYEHFIINDDFERAYNELKSVIVGGKHSSISHENGVKLCQTLIAEYNTSPLLQSLKKQLGEE